MELVDGAPVDEYCAKNLVCARRIEIEVLLTGHRFHSPESLVIRTGDIKPGNVLGTPDGFPNTADFGI
ncbi:MAG: hypothetical protein IPJ98_28310 [Bryobacterales bacterium]|nr:hypothetical protein [Bryobacterales bacterium]